MPGDKYVSTDKKVTFTVQGSTTPINIGIYGRNFTWTRQIEDIDATGYGDDSRVHLPSKKDVNASMDMMYDDDHEIEDVLEPGTRGTLTEYPFGEVSGLRYRQLTCYIGSADINEPYDDVASGSVNFMNTGVAGMTTGTVA